MTLTEEKISAFVETQIEDDPSLFLVSVKLSGNTKFAGKLKVLIDGDEGINIDVCAKISRALGEWLEEEEIIESAYNLEVSSPGVDHPLESERQYQKNIGRALAVVFKDGNKVEGELLSVGASSFELHPKAKSSKGKKKKKVMKETQVISYANVKSSTVVIKF